MGTIFGRPMAFNNRADPNQRVFQDTLLKNNTVIRVTPGKYKYDSEKLKAADKVLAEHAEKLKEIREKGTLDGNETLISKLNQATQEKLIKNKLDMRYLTFEPAMPAFLRAYQLLLNRASTSLFSRGFVGQDAGYITTNIRDALVNLSANEDKKYRGFSLWVEKSTSVSESVSNSFTSSVFEGLTGKVSRMSREFQQILGFNVGNNAGDGQAPAVETKEGVGQSQADLIGRVISQASASLSGSKVILPSIWEDSRFDRSYNISFRFVSPYGDDRSVFMNVIQPFLFILAMSLPCQDGPSGMTFPFLVQMDCPGYFSTPMGCITNLSFVKGGQDNLWNSSGLPLVIEGTFSVGDLYASLSLPLEDQMFAVNFGTAAFVNNLVGASLYSAYDESLSSKLTNYVKGGLLSVTDPLQDVRYGAQALMRYTGIDETKVPDLTGSAKKIASAFGFNN
jgi:hypothetical protein